MKKETIMAAAFVSSLYPALNGASPSHGQIFTSVTGGMNSMDTNDIACGHTVETLSQYLNTCPAGSAEEMLFRDITQIEVSRLFEYKSMSDMGYTELDDSEQVGVCAPFKMISCDKGTDKPGKTILKGLSKCIDGSIEDDVDRAIELAVQELRERLSRIDLIKMIIAAKKAAPTKTINVEKGLDLDCAIEDLVDDQDCPANTMMIGRGYKKLRKALYGQPDLANNLEDHKKFTPEEIATYIGLERVILNDFKFKQGDKKSWERIFGSDALIFNSGQRLSSPAGIEYDPVSFARFWSPVGTDRTPGDAIEGGRWGVNVKPGPRAKTVVVEVFNYSQLIVVNTSNMAHVKLVDKLA